MFKNIPAISLIFFLVACSSSTRTTTGKHILTAAELRPYGRSIMNNQNELELISSAVHFGFSFTGVSCKIFVAHAYEGGHNYMQYVLDGLYQKRIRVGSNMQEPIVITAAGEGPHTVWIYKATEAHTGALLVKEIEGNNLVALRKPVAPLIEFIGNSITCGAAADASDVACGAGEYHDQHSAYFAYGPRLARTLGAEFMLSSVSGIGIYRNWNSDGPIMPEVYEKTDFRLNSQSNWDFDSYDPKIVSIALGTNDFSNGDGVRPRLSFDSGKFVSNYIQFVKLVQSKYPRATIMLLSSPMLNGSKRILLQHCLTAVKESVDMLKPSRKPVNLFFFKPMMARGCGGHPSVEDHAILAEELAPFVRKLLKGS